MKKRGLGCPDPEGPKQVTELSVIRDLEFPLVAASWKGSAIIIKVRELSEVQLRACGDFSLIDLGEIKALQTKNFRWDLWVKYADTIYKIVRAALVAPSYDEILAMTKEGSMVRDAEARFKEIKKEISGMQRGPARQALEAELNRTRCQYDLLLPEDFIASIISYATGMVKSDIKMVTREMLLSAAVLAERGGDNPADHISGKFTDFNRGDINRRAWGVLQEEREKKGR